MQVSFKLNAAQLTRAQSTVSKWEKFFSQEKNLSEEIQKLRIAIDAGEEDCSVVKSLERAYSREGYDTTERCGNCWTSTANDGSQWLNLQEDVLTFKGERDTLHYEGCLNFILEIAGYSCPVSPDNFSARQKKEAYRIWRKTAIQQANESLQVVDYITTCPDSAWFECVNN